MLKKMGLSRDADYKSRWVVPILQLLLTFLTPALREVRRRKEGVKPWTIAARFCRSHISMSRSLLNWHKWQGRHKTIKTFHLWVYLQNLHHLVYSVVFTSIYHVFFHYVCSQNSGSLCSLSLSLNTKWLHKLCEGRIKPEGSGFTSCSKAPGLCLPACAPKPGKSYSQREHWKTLKLNLYTLCLNGFIFNSTVT